jgi:hypothetical protein
VPLLMHLELSLHVQMTTAMFVACRSVVRQLWRDASGTSRARMRWCDTCREAPVSPAAELSNMPDPMDIPEGPRQLQPPDVEDVDGERGQRPPRARGPVDTERLYRKFTGTYPALVEALLQLRPDPVRTWSWLSLQLLRRPTEPDVCIWNANDPTLVPRQPHSVVCPQPCCACEAAPDTHWLTCWRAGGRSGGAAAVPAARLRAGRQLPGELLQA